MDRYNPEGLFEAPELPIHTMLRAHEEATEVLEAIKYFERRKKTTIENINGFAGEFNQLRSKYHRDIDTLNRCIDRMWKRYKRIMSGNMAGISFAE